MMIYLWGIRRPGRFPPPSFFFLKFIAIHFLIRPAIYIWILSFFFWFFYNPPSKHHLHPPSRLPSYLFSYFAETSCSYRNGTKIIREKMAENVVQPLKQKKKEKKNQTKSCWLIICSVFIFSSSRVAAEKNVDYSYLKSSHFFFLCSRVIRKIYDVTLYPSLGKVEEFQKTFYFIIIIIFFFNFLLQSKLKY